MLEKGIVNQVFYAVSEMFVSGGEIGVLAAETTGEHKFPKTQLKVKVRGAHEAR